MQDKTALDKKKQKKEEPKKDKREESIKKDKKKVKFEDKKENDLKSPNQQQNTPANKGPKTIIIKDRSDIPKIPSMVINSLKDDRIVETLPNYF